jgi:hypothetical protein
LDRVSKDRPHAVTVPHPGDATGGQAVAPPAPVADWFETRARCALLTVRWWVLRDRPAALIQSTSHQHPVDGMGGGCYRMHVGEHQG